MAASSVAPETYCLPLAWNNSRPPHNRRKESFMSVARVTEIKSSSKKSFADAVEVGVSRANKTLKNVRGAWVKEMNVECGKGGKITEYRVLLKVTFILED
jgi:flavin-binding protein dodecin